MKLVGDVDNSYLTKDRYGAPLQTMIVKVPDNTANYSLDFLNIVIEEIN